jgi:hypothetical protein
MNSLPNHPESPFHAGPVQNESPYGFRPGVIAQQAISALHERNSRSIDGESLHRRLPAGLAEAWTPRRIDELLGHFADKGWLERGTRGWGIGPKAEPLWGRGVLHGNMDRSTGVSVVDQLTGEEIGQVQGLEGVDVSLGGRGRRAIFSDKHRVVTESSLGENPAVFASSAPAPVSARMARSLLGGCGVPVPCRTELNGAKVLFHGLGTAGGAALAGCWPKAELETVGPLAIRFRANWPAWPATEKIAGSIARNHRSIGRSLSMGAFHPMLPEEEQLAAVRDLCETRTVEDLVRSGVPAEVVAAHEELWTQAADWAG